MKFREFLNEFRSNIPQGSELSEDNLKELLLSATLLKFVIFIRTDNSTEKDITLYENSVGANDKFIILTDRRDKDDIVGYAYLNNSLNENFWQVKDITIFSKYRYKGVGTNLYIKLVREGYNLMNGFSLSSEIEKVWRKLPEHVNIFTWDKVEDKLSDFDERPKQDNKWDTEQRYFWVAMAKPGVLKESQWHAPDDRWFNEWIHGRFSYSFGSEHFDGDF
jgi:hypothetical protein